MSYKLGDKIIIIGSSGAGKSTLARQLSELLGLPVIHLDKEFWNPGWVQTPKDEFIEKQKSLLSAPRWIADGNFSSTLELRLTLADTAILLDFGRLICISSVLKRWVGGLGKTRADMGEGCPEKIDIEFLKWIWNFPKNNLPKVMDVLMANEGFELIIIKNRRNLRRFIAGITPV